MCVHSIVTIILYVIEFLVFSWKRIMFKLYIWFFNKNKSNKYIFHKKMFFNIYLHFFLHLSSNKSNFKLYKTWNVSMKALYFQKNWFSEELIFRFLGVFGLKNFWNPEFLVSYFCYKIVHHKIMQVDRF